MTSLRDRIITKVNRQWGFTRRNDIGAADIVDVVLTLVGAELMVMAAERYHTRGGQYATAALADAADRIAPEHTPGEKP